VKNLSIKKAIELFKVRKAEFDKLNTPEFKAVEKDLKEVKDFIADYAKEQGAFSMLGVNVAVTPVEAWDNDKLEAFALRHPDLDKCRKQDAKRATITLIN